MTTPETTPSSERAGTFLENWNARHLTRYTEQVERGEHDHDCEQRERSSLCHCSKRRREREGKTTLPMIEFAYPTCSGCRNEVDHDGDNFTCPTCRVVWDRHATDGDTAYEFTDEHGDAFGGEQFGERLIVLYHTRPARPDCTCGAVEVSAVAQHLVPCPLSRSGGGSDD